MPIPARTILYLICLWFVALTDISAAVPEVQIAATPDAGVQPRLVTDAEGEVHLLYFKNRLRAPAAREGNLYYRQYLKDQGRFSQPVKVSTQAFNLQSYAIARAALAIDGQGRAHVLWYQPRSDHYFYTRSNSDRTAFEQQRSMVNDFIEGHDAGGDIAALGNKIAIVWGAGDLSREDERTMFARFSHDGGETFGSEMMISNPDYGACACCAMAAEYLNDQELLVAYRSAIDGVGRHMQLLTVDGVDNSPTGSHYEAMQSLREWEASFCPLSTNDIAAGGNGGEENGGQDWLVFETESRIIQMALPAGEAVAVAEPFSETRQKNPAVAVNAQGQRLIVWGEAISHTRGGRLNMSLFDSEGLVADFQFEEDIAIGDFSFPAVAAIGPDRFLVLY